MKVDRAEIEARFRDMSDEELLARGGSGELTALAWQVAKVEALRRGLPLPDLDSPTPPEGALRRVGLFLDPIAAEALKVRLQAEGLSPQMHYANGGVLGNVGLAGVRVMVPESELADAERIRAAMEAGEYAIDENFDVGSSPGDN